jgi:hypothetical protein
LDFCVLAAALKKPRDFGGLPSMGELLGDQDKALLGATLADHFVIDIINGLSQLHPITVAVFDMDKFSVFLKVYGIQNFHVLCPQTVDQCFEIGNAVIDHEVSFKIITFRFERRPLGKSFLCTGVSLAPLKIRTILICDQSQVFSVPLASFFRVGNFKKNTAYCFGSHGHGSFRLAFKNLDSPLGFRWKIVALPKTRERVSMICPEITV